MNNREVFIIDLLNYLKEEKPMAKITYSAVDRCDLEKSLLEEKTTKYVVIYPTYEILCNKDSDADYSAGTVFSVPTPNDDSDTCTNIFGVLAEIPCLPRYFSLRAILAGAGAYCRAKNIGIMLIPAAMLNEVLDDDINRDMLASAIKETLAGINIDVIVTPNVTEDDQKVLDSLRDAKEHFEEARRARLALERSKKAFESRALPIKSKKDKKKDKDKKKKKGKKNKK